MEILITSSEEKKLFSIYLLIIILPFLLFYWIAPFVSDSMMGNDFRYSVHQQMEILFSIMTGSFPLYHPAYALGQSSIVLTWSQVFHPISWLAYIMPGYWNGMAVEWYTFYKLLSLGFTQLILFLLLRKLKVNLLFSFLISLITVYNLRMLDLFRFGASLEAYTGLLILCVAIGWYYISPARWLGPVSIIASAYMLVISGHPQFMYYGLIGAVLFTLVAPSFFSTILDRHIRFRDALRFWARTGGFLTLGILLASVYIFPFVFDFYPSNTGRADAAYEWSVANIGIFEILGNFFMPYLSDVHGAFGGSSLILMAAILPVVRLFKVKIPGSVWAVWGIVLMVILFMLGDLTPVYKWAWSYLPFLSSFRHQGRISIVIPIFLMLLLIWTVKTESYPYRFMGFSGRLSPYSILALIALLLTPVYYLYFFLLKPYTGGITPLIINDVPRWIIYMIIISGASSLIGLFLYGINQRVLRLIGTLLLLMAVLQIGVLLRYGTFTDPLETQPTFEEMRDQKREKMGYRSHEVVNMHTSATIKQIRNSFIEPFIGRIFTQVVPVAGLDESYARMEQERSPHQVFIEGYGIDRARMITEGAKGMIKGHVELSYSSFNRMMFRAVSQYPAVFGFSYPDTGHWRAWVNGERVRIYRANGTAHAVEIPGGESLIEFRYWSYAYFWGMAVSCTVFALIGLFIYFRALKGTSRFIAIAVIMTISVGGFMLWYNSLYSGDDLETEYSWTYVPPLKTPNFAYGKKTSGYYPPSESLLRFHGSNAVDGETKKGSGFTLTPIDKALIIDLNRSQEIKTILLYGDLTTRPEISLSQDGIRWQNVVLNGNNSDPLNIIFDKPEIARFLKVRAIDSSLMIDELEVYGPSES